MKSRKRVRTQRARPDNRWRLQEAKARLSEVVRQAQNHGPQRVTLHGRDAVVVVRADEFDRMRRPVSGLDIVSALASSPLAEVNFERLTVKSPVRDVDSEGLAARNNVVSELQTEAGFARCRIRRRENGDMLFTTEVTFAEIDLVSSNSKTRAVAPISSWVHRTLRPLFAGRVLTITDDVIVRWKATVTEGQRHGHTFGQPDLFIAAIAALEDTVVATRGSASSLPRMCAGVRPLVERVAR